MGFLLKKCFKEHKIQDRIYINRQFFKISRNGNNYESI